MRWFFKIWKAGWRVVSDADTVSGVLGQIGWSATGVITLLWSYVTGLSGPVIFVVTLGVLASVLVLGVIGFGFWRGVSGWRADELSRLVAEGAGILAEANEAGPDAKFNSIVNIDYELWASNRTRTFLTEEFSEAKATAWHTLGDNPIDDSWGKDEYRNRRLTEMSLHLKRLQKILDDEIEK